MIDSILQIFDERYLFALMKMEKWFVISALFLLMDFVTLVINGAFHRAFKDFKETPKASDFIQEDANELKAPVLAFVVQETITEIKSIAVTIYLFYSSRSLRSSKQKLDIHYICHRCIV